MKTLFSRRRLCLAVVLSPLLAATTARAQEPPLTNADLPAATLHAIGTRMLREGRTFEKAAERFQQATQKAPREPSHYLALGCALASRTAAIVHAAAFRYQLADERATYPERVKAWEKARDAFKAENPEAFAAINYDQFKPKLPATREFATKDDNVPLTLTDAQIGEKLTLLFPQAQAAWGKGIALCKTDVEKAQAYYVQAWGLYVLQSSVRPSGSTLAPWATAKLTSPDLLKAALKAADQAVALAPENPLYRQTIGDLLWNEENEDKKRALAAYQKAADLAPRNSTVLYFLYRDALEKEIRGLYRPKTSDPVTPGETPTPPPEPFSIPLGYLRKALSGDRNNAWPLYEEAALLFRLAPYSIVGPSGNRDATPQQKQAALDAVLNEAARKRGKRAIDLIVQGNLQPHYNVPHYEESVPNLLAVAWRYNALMRGLSLELGGSAHVRELARSVMGYAQVMVGHEENKVSEAVRASRAAIGMGMRLIGEWPPSNDVKLAPDVSGPLVGIAVVSMSYKGLVQTYQAAGDTRSAEAAQKESDAFRTRSEAYNNAIMSRINNESAYDLY